MTRTLLGLLAFAVVASSGPTASAVDAPKKPNILVIVADDLGYADLGCQGCKDIPTPNIDSIAKNGVRFTDGYVTCPVCAPTRAGLMTGRYQQRFGFEHNPGPAIEASPVFGLPKDETTLAERLKGNGYATGMVGKWHLGYKSEFQPTSRGFDSFFGFLSGANNYLPGRQRVRNPIQRGTKKVEEKEYLTDAFGREAVAFIDANKAKPFFLYLPFNAVHSPLETLEKYKKRFPDIKDPTRQTFAAMLGAMDDAVGAVLKKLHDEKLDGNTLVFFVSDNGGPTAQTTSKNDPLRGFKTQVYEGGVRVPFLVQWPEKLKAGQVYRSPVVSLDIHATALAVAGIEAPKEKPLDGVNLLPYLLGENKKQPHDSLFWRMGPQSAARVGDWKLVTLRGKSELYNLAEDIGEKTDLSAKEPEKLKELQAAYTAWNKQMIPAKWTRSEGGAKPEPDKEDGKESKGVAPAPVSPVEKAKEPEVPKQPITKSDFDLSFQRDWTSGSKDRSGQIMTGTETNYIVAHQGKLYAAVGLWNHDPKAPNPGPQVLVKKAHDAPWEVDTAFGPKNVRAAVMASLTFTTDKDGKPLAKPVTMLLAGVNGFEDRDKVTVYSRNDDTGKWEKSIVVENFRKETVRGGNEVRLLFTHTDAVTGIQHLFAAVSHGSLYRGVYNPKATGRIEWTPEPELTGRKGRIMTAGEASGSAYIAVDIQKDDPKNGGLFRRIDGPKPKWEWVAEWGERPDRLGVAWLRGFTAIPDPANKGKDLILVAREKPGVMEVVNPQKGHAVTTEFDVRGHFMKLLDAKNPDRFSSIIAYNDMLPVVHPATGERVHLIGLGAGAWGTTPSERNPGAWYLVRHADGAYTHGGVHDAKNPLPESSIGLRSARTICPSPFPEEKGRVFYFGGFDAAGGPHRDTAWIYKGTLPEGGKEKPQADTKTDRQLWVTPAVRANRVEHRTFESAAAKTKVSYHIYTPEIYDKDKERRFPVLYWLHGSGGGLAGIKPLTGFFDEAIRKEKLPPVLIVFPNGMASSMWCDSKDGKVPMEQVVIKELLPLVDRDFRTIAKRGGRLIEGFSMGGYGAARLGFKFSDLFGTVSILAGGPLDLEFKGPRAIGNPKERENILQNTFGGNLDYYKAQSPLTVAEKYSTTVKDKTHVRMAVGSRDFTADLNRAYSEHLKKLKITHDFTEVPGVPHETLALLKGLGDANWVFYRKAFDEEK